MPSIKGSRRKALRAVARVNWAKMDATSDKELARQIAENPDAAPETSKVPKRKWRIVLPEPDVNAIRAKLGMTQDSFAAAFGVSTATVRNWEQGRRQPLGPARALLTIIECEPKAVLRALKQKRRKSVKPA